MVGSDEILFGGLGLSDVKIHIVIFMEPSGKQFVWTVRGVLLGTKHDAFNSCYL